MRLLDRLSDDYEYAIVWWGQSRSRPTGKAAEMFAAEPDLAVGSYGVDLDITSVVGNVITVSTALTAGAWVGAEVRFVYQVHGVSYFAARVGIGTVTANTTSTLTVTWVVSPPTLPTAGTVTFTVGPPSVGNKAAHLLVDGDRITFSSTGTLPPELTAGTTYYATNCAAGTFEIKAALGDAGSITLSGTGTGTHTVTPHVGGYVHAFDKWKGQYPSVRILTPFLPETPGGYPTTAPKVPGYTVPSGIISYSDLALWLEFGFWEGVEGIGYTDTATVSGVTVTPAAVPSWGAATNLWKGATVLVSDAAGNRWVATVASSLAATFDVAAWTPASPAPSGSVTIEVHLPHHRNNPRHALEGLRYFNSDMQPGGWAQTGECYCRPRHGPGTTMPLASYMTYSGSTPMLQFGSAIAFAWRLSARIGRRVSIIDLGVDGLSLTQIGHPTVNGYQGTLGWWNPGDCADFSLSRSNGMAARLQRLIETMAPAATQIAGTAPLRVLGIVGLQGEADATSSAGRANYRQNLSAMLAYIRAAIDGAGMNPYPTDAKVPVLHPSITAVWEYWDTDGEVNAAIADVVARDGFAATLDTEGFPTTDGVHFNGAGEAQFAAAGEVILGQLIEEALGFELGAGEIEVANAALSLIGEPANVVSLDPPNGTLQAQKCGQFFTEARKAVLQRARWTFATKRVVPVAVDSTVSTWLYSYAVPRDLLTVVSVLDQESGDDLQTGIVPLDVNGMALANPLVNPLSPASQPYRIEIDRGVRVLRTNQLDPALRYISATVPVDEWDPLVRQALMWRLAYMLVGQFSKGKTGASLAAQYLQASEQLLAQAAVENANGTQDVRPEAKASWLP